MKKVVSVIVLSLVIAGFSSCTNDNVDNTYENEIITAIDDIQAGGKEEEPDRQDDRGN